MPLSACESQLQPRDLCTQNSKLLQTPNLNLDTVQIPVQIRGLSGILKFDLFFLGGSQKVPYPRGRVRKIRATPATGPQDPERTPQPTVLHPRLQVMSRQCMAQGGA
jgi:hypothetical protein